VPSYHGTQVLHTEWLVEEYGPKPARVPTRRLAAKCGHQYDRQRAVHGPELLEDLQPGADGHSDVTDEQIDELCSVLVHVLARHRHEESSSIWRFGNGVPVLPQRLDYDASHLVVVLRDENARAMGWVRCESGRSPGRLDVCVIHGI
jgi:hypothetical protein